MAERIRKRHDESTRAAIQVRQIVNRLQKHIDGAVEMSTTQIRAAEILLKKTLPDLSQATMDVGMSESFLSYLKALNARPTEPVEAEPGAVRH